MTGRALTARERSRRAYARKKERMASDPEYRERILSAQRKRERVRREKNPDAVREANRKYREANREARNEAARKWRLANPERAREMDRAWRERNLAADRERCREYQRQRRRDDPEAVRAGNRAWREANPDAVWESRIHQKAKNAGATATVEDRQLIREWIGIVQHDPCAYSRERCPTEHLDHIDPLANGGEHRWDNLVGASAQANYDKQATPLLLYMLRELEGSA